MRPREKMAIRRVLFCLFLGAAMCLPGISPTARGAEPLSEHPMEVFADGMEAMEDGQYGEAEANFLRAIEMDPENLQFQYYLALNYRKKGDADHAVEILTSLLEESPRDYRQAYFDIAAIYSEQSQYEKALEVLGRAREEDPADGRAWLEAGVVERSAKKYSAAVSDLRKAKELNPGLAQTADTLIGAVYFDQGRYPEAEAAFNRVITADPESRMARDARSSLAAIAREKRVMKPWRLSGTFALAYDSNAALEAEVTPEPLQTHEGKEDWYETLELYGDWRPVNEKTLRAGFRGSFVTTGYKDLAQNNVLAYRPGAFVQADRDNLHLNVRYDFSYYYTGGSKENIADYGWFLTFNSSTAKLWTHQISPTLAIVEPHGLKTDLLATWVDKHYLDETPDADGWLLGAIQSWSIGKTKRTVRAGYRWYKEDSDDPQYEYFYHEISCGVSSPVYWGIIGDLGYAYTRTSYRESPVLGTKPNQVRLWDGDRRDRAHQISLNLTKSFNDNMDLVFTYSYYNNDSNISDRDYPEYDPYNYKRNLVRLAFTYKM